MTNPGKLAKMILPISSTLNKSNNEVVWSLNQTINSYKNISQLKQLFPSLKLTEKRKFITPKKKPEEKKEKLEIEVEEKIAEASLNFAIGIQEGIY